MKNTSIIFCLLISLSYTAPAKAQKAYSVVTYKSIVDGNQFTLELADGYLLASTITIRSKVGHQVFTPSANEPDARGNYQFDLLKSTGRYKKNKGVWLRLEDLYVPEYPSKIKAIYCDGKIQKTIFFKQQN